VWGHMADVITHVKF